MADSKEKIICPNCGSSNIGIIEATQEKYCKKCGTILEEELLRA